MSIADIGSIFNQIQSLASPSTNASQPKEPSRSATDSLTIRVLVGPWLRLTFYEQS